MGTNMPKKIEFGGADIAQVEELILKMPLSMITADEALIANLPSWLFPKFIDSRNEWDMVWQSWIIVVDGRVVVVDPCTGNGRNFPDFPPAHMLNTPYIERFAASGIRPEDVDYVFCTHLHMDHCGWNTVMRDGRYVPTFPNARYIIVRREYDRWDVRRSDYAPVPANAGVFENSVLPVVDAGLAELVADTFQISSSLSVEPAYGHTAGHSMLHLVSSSKEAYFVGDVFHHPIELLHPEIDDKTSEVFEQTLPTRRRIIETCIAKKALVIPAHFGCAFGGLLARQSGEVVFEPLPYD
jgi:glyoxylase-like metal-dependent hydrolase (beta-lactamase superfamily II)